MTQVTVEHMYYTGNRACSCYLSCNYVDHAMLQYPRFFLLPEFSGSTSSSTFCAFIGMRSVQGAFDDIHQCTFIFVFVFVFVFLLRQCLCDVILTAMRVDQEGVGRTKQGICIRSRLPSGPV